MNTCGRNAGENKRELELEDYRIGVRKRVTTPVFSIKSCT